MMGQETQQEWERIGRSRETLNNIVADAMRDAILSGQFKPGDRLPEPQLAERFGVSRNPIREALKVLSNEGLIEISPRKGARVTLLSPEELSETIELRAELEGLSARNAARHCHHETRTALQALLDEGNSAAERGNMAELQIANDRVHAQLGEAAHNRYLAEFMRSLRDRTYWLFSSQASGRAMDSWAEHSKILQAVIAGQEDLAADLAMTHVLKVGETVVKSMPVAAQSGDD